MKITAIHCQIKKLQVDATVNAANSSLLGGGGVDGESIVTSNWLKAKFIPAQPLAKRQAGYLM